MKDHDTILAGRGFPWGSLVIWAAVAAVGTAVGVYGLHVESSGAAFLVSAMAGNAAFAASLR